MFMVEANPCTAKFKILASYLGDTRMFMRLFESLREYNNLIKLQNEKSSEDLLVKSGNSISWILYWLFENLGILSKHKIINANSSFFFKSSYVCLVLHFLTKIYILYKEYAASKDDKAKKSIGFGMFSELIDVIGILPYLGLYSFLTKYKSFVGFYCVWDCYCASRSIYKECLKKA